MLTRTDTIAAIATAPGAAAIGIVRISGSRAAGIVERVVPDIQVGTKPRRVVSGWARDPISGNPIDEVLCFYCPGPATATGEDTAEIHGHGGPHVMQQLLAATYAAGAVPAEPGEFTYRAFRHGRLDLTQAEAVMGLIGAQSERAAQVAAHHLSGSLGEALEAERDDLTAVSAHIEAGIDFPDEALPIDTACHLAERLETIGRHLKALCDTFALGARLVGGARVAIVGPPNAGKSSLLNRLVGQDRALVDPEPGTTRDIVEAQGEAQGIPVTYSDTAGLRSNAGRVEKMGIKNALNASRAADAIIFVIDGSVPLDPHVDDVPIPDSAAAILAVNKLDLPHWSEPPRRPPQLSGALSIPISALTGQGMDRLIDGVAEQLTTGRNADTHVLTTARQHTAVTTCAKHVTTAARLLRQGGDVELIAADLRWAREHLAALWGRDATEDMLTSVFAQFCIGK
ncbi:MAG: tRNA uridine-5-carboxymethylaminomethyl(34) synthesis GTPase MnmE [Myxococcota bacterium]|nr:tRNA uridine-5-carboxymethylaminomethyl(34) synthesis GTPase MnmE [Myxococcota bacterium]